MELGLTLQEVAAAGAIRSRDTVSKVEHGQPVRAMTLRGIDRALGWPTGTCEEILRGGAVPTPVDEDAPILRDEDERVIWSLTRLDRRTREQMLALKRRHQAEAAIEIGRDEDDDSESA